MYWNNALIFNFWTVVNNIVSDAAETANEKFLFTSHSDTEDLNDPPKENLHYVRKFALLEC